MIVLSRLSRPLRLSAVCGVALAAVSAAAPAGAETLFADTDAPVIVQGKACFGLGCASGQEPNLLMELNQGDTPAIRLLQHGGGGYAPQTWDVAGNEANFFIRDVTNGSRLPFRIRPGAPTSSIDIAADGTVGLGTPTSPPDSPSHVKPVLSVAPTGDVAARGAVQQGADPARQENVQDVDPAEILAVLRDLPIQRFEYATDPTDSTHLAPSGAAFRAALGLGGDDDLLAPGDVAAAALAGVRALAASPPEEDERVPALVTSVKALEQAGTTATASLLAAAVAQGATEKQVAHLAAVGRSLDERAARLEAADRRTTQRVTELESSKRTLSRQVKDLSSSNASLRKRLAALEAAVRKLG